MGRDGELIQTQYFCNHADAICHRNSSYVTTKLYETLACECNNNMIFQNELFSRFLPTTYVAWQHHQGFCESWKMATLMNSSFFVFKMSLRRNYRVKYYYFIVKWCSASSGIACDWCASLDISSILALK